MFKHSKNIWGIGPKIRRPYEKKSESNPKQITFEVDNTQNPDNLEQSALDILVKMSAMCYKKQTLKLRIFLDCYAERWTISYDNN